MDSPMGNGRKLSTLLGPPLKSPSSSSSVGATRHSSNAGAIYPTLDSDVYADAEEDEIEEEEGHDQQQEDDDTLPASSRQHERTTSSPLSSSSSSSSNRRSGRRRTPSAKIVDSISSEEADATPRNHAKNNHAKNGQRETKKRVRPDSSSSAANLTGSKVIVLEDSSSNEDKPLAAPAASTCSSRKSKEEDAKARTIRNMADAAVAAYSFASQQRKRNKSSSGSHSKNTGSIVSNSSSQQRGATSSAAVPQDSYTGADDAVDLTCHDVLSDEEEQEQVPKDHGTSSRNAGQHEDSRSKSEDDDENENDDDSENGSGAAGTFVQEEEVVQSEADNDNGCDYDAVDSDDDDVPLKILAMKHAKKIEQQVQNEEAAKQKVKAKRKTFKMPQSTPSTYIEMVQYSIEKLKERNGSSVHAILKYMLATFEKKLNGKKNVRSNINNAVKAGLKTGRFLRIRQSYKLNPAWLKKEKSELKAKFMAKQRKEKERAAALKKQSDDNKKQTEKNQVESMLSEVEQVKKEVMDRIDAKKMEELREARLLQERIRKRRFPMEDLALIAEDLELKLPNPPEGVSARPCLPPAFDGLLECSLVPDLMHVYHFLFGDVNYCSMARKAKDGIKNDLPSCPDFTIKHLAYALAEVKSGNSAGAKCLPPLLTHIFTMLLRLLLSDESEEEDYREEKNVESEDEYDDEDVEHEDDESEILGLRSPLEGDFGKLASCLTPSSWTEILRHYAELMHRIVLEKCPSGFIDQVEFVEVNGIKQPCKTTRSNVGYLGTEGSPLYKVVQKLALVDAWHLNVEEVILLLRTLCDDVLATRPSITRDIARRGDELHELLKRKRAAEIRYRKVRLAYVGPKYPKKPKDKDPGGIKTAASSESCSTDKDVNESKNSSETVVDLVNGQKEAKSPDDTSSNDITADIPRSCDEPKHVPTVTKREFEEAQKEKNEALEAYQLGLRTLISRSGPVGKDRHYNIFYFVPGDEGMLLVECNPGCSEAKKPPQPTKTWFSIETKSLYEAFISSLDRRGLREMALYDALEVLNVHDTMRDDAKRDKELQAAGKKVKDLEDQLHSALVSMQLESESGRRSGRLTGSAQTEVTRISRDLEIAKEDLEEMNEPPEPPDYEELTGLELLANHDNKLQKKHLKTLSKEDAKGFAHRSGQPPKHCPGLDASQHLASTLWRDGGVVEVLVSEVVDLEDWCSKLASWVREDMQRDTWVSRLRETVTQWKKYCVLAIGPEDEDEDEDEDSTSNTETSKERIDMKEEDFENLMGVLKDSVLDLEARIYQETGMNYSFCCKEEADENMSVSSEAEKEVEENLAWKKLVQRFNVAPNLKAAKIREILIQAIAAARGASLEDVAKELCQALKRFRIGAGAEAKKAALAVLDRHGGYNPMVGRDSLEGDETETMTEVASALQEDVKEDEESECLLTETAVALNGCLRGDETADREDWRRAVCDCRTLSRLCALTQAFVQSAMGELVQLQNAKHTFEKAVKSWQQYERDAAEESTSRRSGRGRGGKKNGKKKIQKKPLEEQFDSSSELWTQWRPTDQVMWCKVSGQPSWPAHKCVAKEEKIVETLNTLNRTIFCRVGEERIHVLKEGEFRKYSSKSGENLSKFSQDTIEALTKTIEMTKRINRGQGIVAACVGNLNREEENAN